MTASIPAATPTTNVDEPREPRWDREHRRYRRAVARSVAVPLAAGAALAVVAGVYGLVVGQYSALDQEVYDGLRVGSAQSSVEPMLPVLRVDPPSWVPAPPRGTHCRYQARRANPLTGPTAVYRLCFADGRLVSKDDLTWDGEDR